MKMLAIQTVMVEKEFFKNKNEFDLEKSLKNIENYQEFAEEFCEYLVIPQNVRSAINKKLTEVSTHNMSTYYLKIPNDQIIKCFSGIKIQIADKLLDLEAVVRKALEALYLGTKGEVKLSFAKNILVIKWDKPNGQLYEILTYLS